MDTSTQEQIRQALRQMAAAHATAMRLMEQTLALFAEEVADDSQSVGKTEGRPTDATGKLPRIDRSLLSVVFHGRSCFLGNTLLYRFLSQLVTHPNAYLPYEDLLADVWQASRTDAAVRSVVKRLRSALRKQGLEDLANAIDGSVPGYYALKIA